MTTGRQPILGALCAWCDLPAVDEVTVEPAKYEKGDGGLPGKLLQRSKKAYACDDHLHVTDDQPAPIGAFRRRKAKGVVQLDIFGGDDSRRSANAIYGDAA